jgi:hypothetical protein
VNGQSRDEKLFRKMSCYIMQEDLLQPLLTLQEVMLFAAELKLPSDTPKKDKLKLVSTASENPLIKSSTLPSSPLA